MAALSLFLRSLVFENDPQYLSLQYTLKIRSLSMVWNENDRFWLVFTKTLVFMPKTGSLHTGTVKPTFWVWCLNSYLDQGAILMGGLERR
jgi:hypothetical protein